MNPHPSQNPHQTPRADDGTPLEVKEGVLLDRDGNPAMPESSGFRFESAAGNLRVWRGGWLFSILMGILIPILFVMGFAIVAVIVGLLLIGWLLRSFFRAFR